MKSRVWSMAMTTMARPRTMSIEAIRPEAMRRGPGFAIGRLGVGMGFSCYSLIFGILSQLLRPQRLDRVNARRAGGGYCRCKDGSA